MEVIMKFEYITVTGPVAIEADEQLCGLLSAMDNDEGNNNRKHSRRYPVSLEGCEYEGEWFEDKADPISDTDAAIDRERALALLTELQRLCFVEVCLNGRTQREVANIVNITQQAVDKHIRLARNKLKKYFWGCGC
jgi:DNA-directed RNA polymerase specialized sigma24 family protein